jgi:5,6,7,8-tetrahydromethanopterin hydro-lyase
LSLTTSQIGEAFVGEGVNAAHVNTVLGRKGGPLETAWATALATPRQGHAAFVVAVQPSLAVKPLTLFVNKAEIRGDRHAELTWGAAQAGVARGVVEAVQDGVVATDAVDDLLLIAAVWVNWEADDDAAVYANNAEATRTALRAGAQGLPHLDEVLGAGEPWNAFFPPSE